jgi:two-component system, OmpR family, response regulator
VHVCTSTQPEMKILLVEDDARTAAFIVKGLKQEGFAVQHVADGADGRALALHEDYDAAIIDIMLPSVDGLRIVADMRSAGKTTPVIILSAKRSVDDRVEGLRKGGDDYLTKPFAFTELVARLRALMRRAQTPGAEPTRFTVGDLCLDLLSRSVRRGQRGIDLQPREFTLLEYLMRNAGRVVSKTMIVEHVWDYDFDPQTNVVESRISRLRGKIDAQGEAPLIHTVRGVGYVLRQES